MNIWEFAFTICVCASIARTSYNAHICRVDVDDRNTQRGNEQRNRKAEEEYHQGWIAKENEENESCISTYTHTRNKIQT